jgi:hypothetical protein
VGINILVALGRTEKFGEKSVERIQLAQDGIEREAFVPTAMDIPVP